MSRSYNNLVLNQKSRHTFFCSGAAPKLISLAANSGAWARESAKCYTRIQVTSDSEVTNIQLDVFPCGDNKYLKGECQNTTFFSLTKNIIIRTKDHTRYKVHRLSYIKILHWNTAQSTVRTIKALRDEFATKIKP